MKSSVVSPERWDTKTDQPTRKASFALGCILSMGSAEQRNHLGNDLRFDGFGDAANLIDLEQKAVAGVLLFCH